MDVKRREDRFLDYLASLAAIRKEATVDLRFIALKHPELADELLSLEHKINTLPPVPEKTSSL